MALRWRKNREDKDVLRKPLCPFCGEVFQRPGDISTEAGVFYGGFCECGAVYGCDLTGKNMGEIFVDTLAYACGGDWEKALSIEEDVDYHQSEISYEPGSHTVTSGGEDSFYGRAAVKLIFIKLLNPKR